MRTYHVAGPHRAYDAMPGETLKLDPADPLVQLNLEAGVLAVGKGPDPAPPSVCPACAASGIQDPPSLEPGDLAAHYHAAHPALVAPTS